MGGRRLLWLAALMFLFGALALGQATTGNISGTIKDSSGAVLPGVEVTILNEDTGISRMVLTDETGRYSVPSLNPSSYRVTATLTGFQTGVRSGIVLTVGREVAV